MKSFLLMQHMLRHVPKKRFHEEERRIKNTTLLQKSCTEVEYDVSCLAFRTPSSFTILTGFSVQLREQREFTW
jgi:hypothetical protein